MVEIPADLKAEFDAAQAEWNAAHAKRQAVLQKIAEAVCPLRAGDIVRYGWNDRDKARWTFQVVALTGMCGWHEGEPDLLLKLARLRKDGTQADVAHQSLRMWDLEAGRVVLASAWDARQAASERSEPK